MKSTDAVAAGDFAAWLEVTRAALACDGPAEVPCGTCTACCRSAFFIHIGPDETESLRRIPAELPSPAPGLPPGHVVLGYDADGRCPLLRDDACSLYEHRPRSCRAFDCRVFAATAVEAEKPLIAEQVRRWAFASPGPEDHAAQAALLSAARFLEEHPECFPGAPSVNPARVAIGALKVQHLFRVTPSHPLVESDGALVAAVRDALERFDAAASPGSSTGRRAP